MKPIETFQKRLQKAINIRNVKPVELHEQTGISESLLSKYLSGNAVARQRKLTLISDALNINEIWLMGYDVPMERYFNPSQKTNDENIVELLNYYTKLNKVGKIKAIENVKDLTKISEYTNEKEDKKTKSQDA